MVRRRNLRGCQNSGGFKHNDMPLRIAYVASDDFNAFVSILQFFGHRIHQSPLEFSLRQILFFYLLL